MTKTTKTADRSEQTFRQIKARYEALRIGQAIYVSHVRAASDRVVGVGRKYLHTMTGAKLTAQDLIDWWHG